MSSPHPHRQGPLAGVRIVDLTTVVLGPYATQMLGDLGADVVKVESPDGDTTRHTGPRRHPGMAAMFLGTNRNKRSIVLDLKMAAGSDVLLRLIDTADVFVHNIRPQKLKGLGLEPEKTGRGQAVEIPMFEIMVSYLMVEHVYGATFVPPEGPMGYARVLAPWRRPYRTADGRICMIAYTDRQWQRFWQAAGRPGMMDDPRFARPRRADRPCRGRLPPGRRGAGDEKDSGMAGAVRRTGNRRRPGQRACRLAGRSASQGERLFP